MYRRKLPKEFFGINRDTELFLRFPSRRLCRSLTGFDPPPREAGITRLRNTRRANLQKKRRVGFVPYYWNDNSIGRRLQPLGFQFWPK